MKVSRVTAAVLFAAQLGSTVALAQATNGGDRSVLSGVFTAEQVAKGRAGHRAFCLSCHGAEAYTGEPFETMWLGRTVFDLFETLRTTMPNDEPGKLTTEEYVDVIAYILMLNGYQPGATPLSYDENELRKVKIDSVATRRTPGDTSRTLR
jgi:mono/diheme cytochrome c family protein